MSYGNILAETDWERARLGIPTASRLGDLFSENERKRTDGKIDPKLSVGAKTYLREKASEILTGYTRQLSTFSTSWGDTYEPEAIEALIKFHPDIIHYGNTNRKFFKYGDFNAGGTPDAETAKGISFEIKCPENFNNHLEYSMMKSPSDMDKDHYYQLQFNMLILAKRLDIPFKEAIGIFVSYCPVIMRKEKRLFRMIVPPDMNFLNMIDEKLIKAQDYIIEVLEEFSKPNLLVTA